jgi:hypothetical protein
MRAYAVRRSSPRSRTAGSAAKASTPIPVRPEIHRLLHNASPATRACLLKALQRSAGNLAVNQLIATTGHESIGVGHGGPANVVLHGDTTGSYDGGTSKWSPRSMKRAANCTDCPEDNPCLHAVGTFAVTYKVDVTIRMPDVPDGLTPCQEKRVRTFLRDVLGPHEREHSRRMHTYDGTTRHPIDFTGCGTDALNAHLQQIHDDEEQKRHDSAEQLSQAIDPFNRPIDLDCQD